VSKRGTWGGKKKIGGLRIDIWPVKRNNKKGNAKEIINASERKNLPVVRKETQFGKSKRKVKEGGTVNGHRKNTSLKRPILAPV